MRRLERKNLEALLLIVTRMIKADNRVDAEEIELLAQLEEQYGFDRSLMTEARHLTLAEAVRRLASLDAPIRQQILESIGSLAKADQTMERHEALLLLALRYCLGDDNEGCAYEVVSGSHNRHGGDLSSYIIYYESETDDKRHKQIDEHWELMNLLMQQQGLQLMVVEHIVDDLCQQDKAMVQKLMGYMAPQLSDDQLSALYDRMTDMDTRTFGQRVLVRDLQFGDLREAKPSLLVSIGRNDMLRIELSDDDNVLTHVRKLVNDYSQLANSGMEALRLINSATQQGHFMFYGYYHDFFSLLVESEPIESRIVLWPFKSEFMFPDADRKLKLTPQEATLYTLILIYNYKKKGLPTCFTKDQKEIEHTYKNIYCLKKNADDKDAIFPDNLAPIRSKIEKKMRAQLEGLDNLEDFIPRNEDREGRYSITAPISMVRVKPDGRQPETGILDYKWGKR